MNNFWHDPNTCAVVLEIRSNFGYNLKLPQVFKYRSQKGESQVTVCRLPKVIKDVVPLCFLSVNRENLSLRFQDSGQQEGEVLDACPGGEEEHRLLGMFPQELDQARKFFRRLASHVKIVEGDWSRFLGRSCA